MIPDDVMAIEELVDYLDRPREQLLELAHAGSLPGWQAAGQWYFRRDVIDRWIITTVQNPCSLGQIEKSDVRAGTIESSDIDEYEEIMVPWDIEYDQLSKGAFQARIDYARLPGILVYEANWRQAARTRDRTKMDIELHEYSVTAWGKCLELAASRSPVSAVFSVVTLSPYHACAVVPKDHELKPGQRPWCIVAVPRDNAELLEHELRHCEGWATPDYRPRRVVRREDS